MFRFIPVFAIVALAYWAVSYFQMRNSSARPRKLSRAERKEAAARAIAVRRKLCAQVDDFIVRSEIAGTPAPNALVFARAAVSEADTEYLRELATQQLIKEWARVKLHRRRQQREQEN